MQLRRGAQAVEAGELSARELGGGSVAQQQLARAGQGTAASCSLWRAAASVHIAGATIAAARRVAGEDLARRSRRHRGRAAAGLEPDDRAGGGDLIEVALARACSGGELLALGGVDLLRRPAAVGGNRRDAERNTPAITRHDRARRRRGAHHPRPVADQLARPAATSSAAEPLPEAAHSRDVANTHARSPNTGAPDDQAHHPVPLGQPSRRN